MTYLSTKLARLNSLTSIRMFCTLWVVIHHLNLARYTNIPLISFIDNYFLHTGRGIVSFFFLLSGFVICYSSMHWSGWKSYLIKRLSRIFPNHWIVALTLGGFTFLIPLFEGGNLLHHLTKALLNLSLLQAFYPDRSVNFAFNGVTWTLSVEFFFYICFIFFRKMTTRNLFLWFLGLLTIKLSLEALWMVLHIQYLAHWLFFVFPIFRLPEFLLGMMLCRVYLNDPSPFLRFKLDPIFTFILTILTIGLCRYYLSCYAIPLYSTIPFLCSFLLLLSCLGHNREQSYFNNKIFLFLGDASFPIYLIHQPVLNGARMLFQKWNLTMTVPLMLLMMLSSLLLALVYHVTIEKKIYTQSVKFLYQLPKYLHRFKRRSVLNRL